MNTTAWVLLLIVGGCVLSAGLFFWWARTEGQQTDSEEATLRMLEDEKRRDLA